MCKSKKLTAALSLALLLAACAQTTTRTSNVQQDNVITVAVVGPMLGDLAPFGGQMQDGAELAVADINTRGGVLGRQLRLVTRDDQCDPPTAERIARELVAADVAFVDGHFCSGSSIPASKIYGTAGILQITPASTNPALTWGGDVSTVMRIAGRDDQQGNTVADWLIARYPGKPVALLDDGRDYGREVIAVIERRIQGSPVQIAVRHSFAGDLMDFTALAQSLAQKGVEAIYVGGFHRQTAAFVRALRAAGSTAEVAASDSLNTTEFWTLAGQAADGVRYTDWPTLAVTPPTISSPFRVVAGSEPTGYAWNSYAAVQAFAAAVEATGSTEGLALAHWLKANRVETVIGGLEWDQAGDIEGITYHWYIWRDGAAYLEE